MIVPKSLAYSIWERLTPDMVALGHGLGCNRWGDKQYSTRSVRGCRSRQRAALRNSKWNSCATLDSLALQSYLGAEVGFATAACEVWVVQLKEADGVSSGKAASSGKVEVMRKRIALQDVPSAWEEDCATVLGCGSAGPMPLSVGA